jgi:hypothetical protein
VYFGLSTGLQLLHVSFLRIVLQNNVFANCIVTVSVLGGNAYGGAVSLYIGGYSSVYSMQDKAAAAVGDTVVRNVSVTLDSARFASCSARRVWEDASEQSGANVYGGSLSFYIGAYSWSKSISQSSNSACGGTITNGISVHVRDTTSTDSEAFSGTSTGHSYGANSYGGSMSALHIGAYAWSYSAFASSSSVCGATFASDICVLVSDLKCFNCRAVSASGDDSYGANVYGGSMSVFHVGAYAWSFSVLLTFFNFNRITSESLCQSITVRDIAVRISSSMCSNCSALSSSGGGSQGANLYGGFMSVLFVGAYSWSSSIALIAQSTSECQATSASDVYVDVNGLECFNCSAMSSSETGSRGANSYAGSMSVFHVGAHSWSSSTGSLGGTSSLCNTTIVRAAAVRIENSRFSHCVVSTRTPSQNSYGANSYGGAMSASYIGAYAYSTATGAEKFDSLSYVSSNHVSDFCVAIINATIAETTALSGEYDCSRLIQILILLQDLTAIHLERT